MRILLVGAGGPEAIDRSHWLGAVHGMERIMGRAENPVRALFDRAAARFLSALPIVHVLTVVGPGPDGAPRLRGLFVGDDHEAFLRELPSGGGDGSHLPIAVARASPR